MQVFGLSTSETDSFAASSGRHRNVTSDALIRRLRSARSLAFVGIDFEQRDIATLGEIFIDLQAGCSFLAVDKNDGVMGDP